MTYKHFNNETMRSSVIRAVANTENETAWQRLFDLYAGFIFSIARSKGLKPEDTDDIVQIVFTDLARNLPTFQYDHAKGKFRSYLTGGGASPHQAGRPPRALRGVRRKHGGRAGHGECHAALRHFARQPIPDPQVPHRETS